MCHGLLTTGNVAEAFPYLLINNVNLYVNQVVSMASVCNQMFVLVLPDSPARDVKNSDVQMEIGDLIVPSLVHAKMVVVVNHTLENAFACQDGQVISARTFVIQTILVPIVQKLAIVQPAVRDVTM